MASFAAMRNSSSVTRSILLLLLGLSAHEIVADNLLLIGDSTDRQATDEWCTMKSMEDSSTVRAVWGPWELSTRHFYKNRLGTLYCKTDLDSVAYVQVYGSGAVGPYYWYKDEKNDTAYNTPTRINLGISSYKSLYGIPDSVQWDITQQTSIKNFNVAEAIAKYRSNTIGRIHDILQLVDKSVDVGLRTAPKSAHYSTLVQSFNEVIRELTVTMNLTLYGYDQDVWSSVNFDTQLETHLFRDWIHLKNPYTVYAADKMVGHQFSTQMSFQKGSYWGGVYSARFDNPLTTCSILHLWRDLASNTTFLLNGQTGLRHRSPSDIYLQTFFLAMRLGPSDVRLCDWSYPYDEILEDKNLPPLFLDGSILNITVNAISGAQLYRYSHKLLRPILRPDRIGGLGKTESEVAQVDTKNAYWTSRIEIGEPVDKVYTMHSDWLLREKGYKSGFLIHNGTRKHMTGPESIYAMNKTFNDIIVVPTTEIATMLPLVV